MNSNHQSAAWHYASDLSRLMQTGVEQVSVNGRQLALFVTKSGVKACDNQCPHQGFPLSKGEVQAGETCVLTCHWHNWKFDLNSGENLYDGDALRVYPVELRADEIWVDLSEPPLAVHREKIIGQFKQAFERHDYERIGREIARFMQLKADPLDLVRLSVHWSWQKMEWGWTHAYAGMADWLYLYETAGDDQEEQLLCLTEAVAHVAFDALREKDYPFAEDIMPFSEAGFLQAIENEDEITAIALLRGALKQKMVWSDLERVFTTAALAHYNDFGHSLIYVDKAGDLIQRLGDGVMEPLLLSLIRSLIYASREDQIPQFRQYEACLQAWKIEGGSDWRISGASDTAKPSPNLQYQQGVNAALKATLACQGQPPEQIYQQLLALNALNMLGFDETYQDKIQITPASQVGWLHYTHGLTFANAVRKQCTRYPEFWPQGLLQMACFSGRNAPYTIAKPVYQPMNQQGLRSCMQALRLKVLDHGLGEYIVSVHWLKTWLAVQEEAELLAEEGELAQILVAALSRFMHSSLKRRHARRTAFQALATARR